MNICNLLRLTLVLTISFTLLMKSPMGPSLVIHARDMLSRTPDRVLQDHCLITESDLGSNDLFAIIRSQAGKISGSIESIMVACQALERMRQDRSAPGFYGVAFHIETGRWATPELLAEYREEMARSARSVVDRDIGFEAPQVVRYSQSTGTHEKPTMSYIGYDDNAIYAAMYLNSPDSIGLKENRLGLLAIAKLDYRLIYFGITDTSYKGGPFNQQFDLLRDWIAVNVR